MLKLYFLGDERAMQRKFYPGLIILLITMILISTLAISSKNTVYAQDKSFSINRLNIDANIAQDGTMELVQTYNMKFTGGPFTIVYQDIPLVANKKTGLKVNIDNIQVFQGDKQFTRVKQQNGRPEGKYFVQNNGDNIHIEWYHNSKDEEKQFIVKYRVIGAVTSYNDTAELYWQFVGDQWDTTIRDISVNVNIPRGAEKSQIKVFGHGPVQGSVEILSPETARWSVDKLSKKSYLEARMLFPTSLIPNNNNKITENKYNTIMDEELQAAKKTDREKRLSFIAVVAGIADIIIAIIVILINYFRYGKKYKIEDIPEYIRELPDGLSPAELNAFVHFDIPNVAAISATVMDLSRRGFISFTRSEKKKVLIHVEEKDVNELKNYEKYLFDFLKKVEAYGGDLKKYVSKNTEDSKIFFDSFKRDVGSVLTSQYSSFYENNMSKAMKLPLIFIVLNVIMLVVGVLYVPVLMIFSIVAMCISIIAFAVSKRKSKEGASHEYRWNSFKKFLKHFSNLDKAELPQITIWEHYLVYAVALGVAKETIRELDASYPNMDSNYYGSWYNGYFVGYYYGAGIQSMESGFGEMNSLFSDIQTTFTEAYTSFTSSSTGGGGGFSGGGGFGGGGGGGGAN